MGTKFDWTEYDRRRRGLRVALLFSLPLWIIRVGLDRRVFSSAAPKVRMSLDFLIWFPTLLIVGIAQSRKMTCPCPACGRPLHRTPLFGSALSRHCLHCGVPIGELSKAQLGDGLD